MIYTSIVEIFINKILTYVIDICLACFVHFWIRGQKEGREKEKNERKKGGGREKESSQSREE